MRDMTEERERAEVVKSYGDVAIHSVQTALSECHRRIRELMVEGGNYEVNFALIKACRIVNDLAIEVVQVVELTNKEAREKWEALHGN